MLPGVDINKVDGGTGVVRPAATGVCAIVAATEKGDLKIAESWTRDDLLLAAKGRGHLLDAAKYIMAKTRKQVVTVGADPTTAGAYGAVTPTNAGTSVITAAASEPLDEFDVVVQFTTGATVGVAGATYWWSLNGGVTRSKTQTLGTANTIAIPNTGVGFSLGAGTILANTKVACKTTAPKITNADLPDVLEALRVTSLRYECILIDMEADAATVTAVGQWLPSVNKKGKFPTVVLTARRRGAAETEAAYRTALEGIFSASFNNDILVFSDVADTFSTNWGITMARPWGWFMAARGMSIGRGVDPAWVELGPIPDARITDERGNPKYHDENNFPGLDDVRIGTARTLDGEDIPPGAVYPTNAPILSAPGSDFVWWQHARTINRGAEIAHAVLTKQLSKGVRKDPTPGPNGERYIAEAEAQKLEGLGNAPIDRELVQKGEVDDMRLIVSRDDDIRSNQGGEITVAVQSVSLGYIKRFKVGIGFVTAIQTPSTAGQ